MMPAFDSLPYPSGWPGRLRARIQALEEQNEQLAAYAVRVKAEIDELKRVINSCH
jgi:molecular chaperone GrpE (heat shock protein)